MRNIEQAYRTAMIAEHAALKASGRDEEAEHVATVLAERYGHEVGGREASAGSGGVLETASQEAPPETATPPAPRRGRPPKAAAQKPAAKE